MSQPKINDYEDIEAKNVDEVDEVRIKNLRQRLKRRPRAKPAPDQASSDEFQEVRRKKKVTFQATTSTLERQSRTAAIKRFSQGRAGLSQARSQSQPPTGADDNVVLLDQEIEILSTGAHYVAPFHLKQEDVINVREECKVVGALINPPKREASDPLPVDPIPIQSYEQMKYGGPSAAAAGSSMSHRHPRNQAGLIESPGGRVKKLRTANQRKWGRYGTLLDGLQNGSLQSQASQRAADYQLACCEKDLVSAKLDLLDATLSTTKVKVETRKAYENLVWSKVDARLELSKANLIKLSQDLEALEIRTPFDKKELVEKIDEALDDATYMEKLDDIEDWRVD